MQQSVKLNMSWVRLEGTPTNFCQRPNGEKQKKNCDPCKEVQPEIFREMFAAFLEANGGVNHQWIFSTRTLWRKIFYPCLILKYIWWNVTAHITSHVSKASSSYPVKITYRSRHCCEGFPLIASKVFFYIPDRVVRDQVKNCLNYTVRVMLWGPLLL